LWSVYAGLDPAIAFDEDCLRLNVWTASTDPEARRPVMVWLHGGGFSWGSGSSPLTVGDRLARDHDIVVVTVNHRLGVLGYLRVDGEPDSAIAGLLDLRLALEWVRDNIAAFGGDPASVTIAGHSGGSAKVACLLALPSARGLFQRAIVMSGVVTLRSMTIEDADVNAAGLARVTGVRDVASLRELAPESLTSMASSLRFRPAVGEPGLPVHPFDPEAAPTAAGVGLLTGVAKDDAATFKWDSDPGFATIDDDELHRRVRALPGVVDDDDARELVRRARSARPGDDPAHLLVAITTDGLRDRTTIMMRLKSAQSDAPIFSYEFAYDITMPPDTAFPGERMAPHGAELPFVFDVADREWLAGDRADRVELASRMSGYWSSFVRTGNPNGPGLPRWERWSHEADEPLVLR
jgi:para-nitrobenzyl esterase